MWKLMDENDSPMITMDFPGDAYENLKRNFDRRYNGNRAPLGIYLHSSWLVTNGENLKKWAEEVLDLYDDVYFVTNYEMIEWIRNPVSASQYATTRDCEGQVTNCIPPKGGCNHGRFDVDKCACDCSPPFVGPDCRFVVYPMSSPTDAPTEEPTVPPKPTNTPTVFRSPTKLPTAAPTGSPEEVQDSEKSRDSEESKEPLDSLSSSVDLKGLAVRENETDDLGDTAIWENDPSKTASMTPDSIGRTGGADEDSSTNSLHVSTLAMGAMISSLMLVLSFEI